jgi:uncharacterized membrane protein YdbT with pleckstrin-like domain
MNSVWRVSDEEVFWAIRYLDPDVHVSPDMHEVPRVESRSEFQIRLIVITLSVVAILYFVTLRYLPAIVRLLG